MKDLILVEGISRWHCRTVVLHEVGFRVPRGLLSVISGAPRSGKTSILRALLGHEKIDQGQCLFLDPVLERRDMKQVLRMGLNPPWIFPWVTCMEYLHHLNHYQKLLDPQAWVKTALGRVGLLAMAHVPFWKLNRVSRVKLWIAAQMVPHSPLLLMDEPMRGLQPAEREDIWLVLRRLVWEGHSVLVTTPFLEEAEDYGEYLVLLDRGRVVMEGEFAQLTPQRRVVLDVEDVAGTAAALRVLGVDCQIHAGGCGVTLDLNMDQAQQLLPLLLQAEVQVRDCQPEDLGSLYGRLQLQASMGQV
ncbi:ATP-binding cassette domain-containing protein [Deinococcus cellulosilyticus]|uniref:ABC transporter domain-containing protein n=1 Tax=Deinococcus cellulosilyticus (strain DSM 18568 / NBRC 106333 / KACC 11606 / 5516J-15) TaxID=1223518 RepID=A0A511NAY0_DEIC1|nr:ATP-binding cassette domain-containing protein [Deinococcus cellulosilyticus]GEM49963.1 hypothetical protein DC3_55980 [Deinococcus cellulosilyticus NBRC 106333 = KACC 11606]